MRTEIRCTRPTNWIPLRRLGARQLTRAHLALDARPQLRASGRDALAKVAAAFTQQLACDVKLSAARVDAAAFPARELGALCAFATFQLSPLGAKAVLELRLPDVVALVERLCGARPSQGPVLELTRLEEGAFGFLALLAVSAVRSESDFDVLWAPRLISIQGDRALVAREIGNAAHVAFELGVDVAETSIKARLYVPGDAVQCAVEPTPQQRPAAIPEPVGRAELSVIAHTGHCELTPETLAALHPGDVVVFEGPRFEEGQVRGPARLRTETFQLDGSFGAEGFIFNRGEPRRFPQEPSMSQSLAESISADAPSHLPVEIEVELTRVSVAISELSALEPGSVLPLHMSVSKPVLLRVGDRVVAKAELVDIEGEVGARVISLCP